MAFGPFFILTALSLVLKREDHCEIENLEEGCVYLNNLYRNYFFRQYSRFQAY